MITIKEFLKYIFPLSVILNMLFQVEWLSDSIIDGPNLQGLLYPHSSDAIGSSFAYEFYWKGIILNTFIYGLLAYILYKLTLSRISNRKVNSSISIILWVLTSLRILMFLLFFSEYYFFWDFNHPVNYTEVKFRSFLF